MVPTQCHLSLGAPIIAMGGGTSFAKLTWCVIERSQSIEIQGAMTECNLYTRLFLFDFTTQVRSDENMRKNSIVLAWQAERVFVCLKATDREQAKYMAKEVAKRPSTAIYYGIRHKFR